MSKIIEHREEQRREKEAAQIAAELARVKAEEEAAKAKEEATKQKPLTKTEADKRQAAQAAKASVKSNAKKRKGPKMLEYVIAFYAGFTLAVLAFWIWMAFKPN